MRNYFLVTLGLLAAAIFAGAGPTNEKPIDAPAAFARLKTLVGEWEATTKDGKARLTYELTGGGTALIERESEGMITVFHLDHDRLILTHYCMAGNQPRMLARSFNPASGDLQFAFLDITNLASPNAGHMHDVRFRFVDNNHLETEWQFYENGKPKFNEAAQYTRVQ